MPADHDFEKSMQQKLDAFRLDPQPSDWQAVYDKLHPKKKRRIIWWWLPVLLALGTAGIWMGNNPAGKGQGTASPTGIEKEVATETEPGEKTADIQIAPQEITSSKAAEELSHETVTDQQDIAKSSAAKENPKEPAKKEEEAKTSNSKKGKTIFSLEMNAAKTAGTFTGKEIASEEKKFDNANTVAEVQTASAVNTDTVVHANAGVANSTVTATQIADSSSQPMMALTPAAPVKENGDSGAAKKSPAKKKSSWKWAAYTGLGANLIAQPISSSKALMDAGNFTTGSAVVSTTSDDQSGWHFAAGAMLEKRWKNRWALAFGAGVNYSTWSSNSQTYKDSISPATAVYSRSVMSTANNHYRLWMAELPIQISNRISGGPSLSFWWTAGFSNQFLLGLNQQQELQSVTTNFTTVSNQKSLTSAATFYQPQLRLGFMFDHIGAKTHWQLQPMMNYGILDVYKSGNPSGTLLNLQLQYRMFLSK